jgi:signal transduction histidine kinase
VAHHVNNALTGVIANLEMALRLAPAEGEVVLFLRDSLTFALRAADAVKRIVAYACRRQHVPALEPVSLRCLAEEAAQRLRSRGQSGVRVRLNGASAGWVRGSEALVRAALDAIVDNALEALPGKGTITLTLRDDGARRWLCVSDTGGGLSAEARAHLFEPFYSTKASGHLGLGLALCREMIEAQGGSIRVVSINGQGTAVTLALPALELPDVADRTAPRHDSRQTTRNPHWSGAHLPTAHVSPPTSAT